MTSSLCYINEESVRIIPLAWNRSFICTYSNATLNLCISDIRFSDAGLFSLKVSTIFEQNVTLEIQGKTFFVRVTCLMYNMFCKFVKLIFPCAFLSIMCLTNTPLSLELEIYLHIFKNIYIVFSLFKNSTLQNRDMFKLAICQSYVNREIKKVLYETKLRNEFFFYRVILTCIRVFANKVENKIKSKSLAIEIEIEFTLIPIYDF